MSRVLIFCDTTAPGGVDAYTVALADFGRQAGHDVTVAIDVDPGADRLASLLAAARISAPRRHLHKNYPEPTRREQIEGLFQSFDPEVVHVVLPAPWAGVMPRELALDHDLPLVATEQSVDASFTFVPELFAKMTRFYQEARVHIAVSEANRRVLVHDYGLPAERLVVIPNNVDIDVFAPPTADRRRAARAALNLGDERALLTLARLHEQKGLDILLDAAAQVPAGDWTLLIAGVGPLEDDLKRQAAELGLGDRVRWLGWCDDSVAALAAADLFVLPSRYEGQPIALLEAMAAGVPVLATAVAGTPEALDDGRLGTLAPPEDPAALAHALRRFLAGELPDRTAAARAQVALNHNSAINLGDTVSFWTL